MTGRAGAAALTLLTRPGCGLCDDFVEAFAAELPQRFAQLALAGVDEREDWRERYGRVIPVLLDAQGTVLCETFFDADRVRAALD